jgi:mannose-6-phosphate isomerase-like protein (cupin superfamily)
MNKTLKKWGYELEIINEDYCGKQMVLFQGYHCSTHYHRIKDETFFVASGTMLLDIEGIIYILSEGERVRILPWQKHSFTGLTDCIFFEFSTHDDPEDSIRITESGIVNDTEWNLLVQNYGDKINDNFGNTI